MATQASELNTLLPRKRAAQFWLLLVCTCILSAPILYFTVISILDDKERLLAVIFLIIFVCINFINVEIERRKFNVIISEDGVRAGKSKRAKYIPWNEAVIIVEKNNVTVKSENEKIEVYSAYFEQDKFWIFFKQLETEGIIIKRE